LQPSYEVTTGVDEAVRLAQTMALRAFLESPIESDNSRVCPLWDMNMTASGEGEEYCTIVRTFTIDGLGLIDILREMGDRGRWRELCLGKGPRE
jgi:hypothetical protein